MVSSTSSLMLGMKDVIETQYPHEFNIYSDETDRGCSEDFFGQIHELQQEEKMNVTAEAYYSYLMVSATRERDTFFTVPADTLTGEKNEASLIFIPLSDYSAFMGTDKALDKDEILVYANRKEFNHGKLQVFGRNYKVKEELDESMGNGIMAANEANSYMVIVSDMTELCALSDIQKKEWGDMASDICYYYGFDTDMPEAGQEMFFNLLLDVSEKFEFQGVIESKSDARANQVGMYGGFFFIGIFIETLFIMAMVVILYYKQISEGYDDRGRFAIMQKIGMSRQEVKASVRSQVQTVFFLPLIVAGIHTAAAFPMISRILVRFNLRNTGLYMTCTVISYLLFAMLYIAVYSLTAKTYYKIVNA